MAAYPAQKGPSLQQYTSLVLYLFQRTPLQAQERLKLHFQHYHKEDRRQWLTKLAVMIGASNVAALNAMACSGTAAADPLAPLNVKVDPDDACQRETGVSAALSDLLHFGMVTMRARAQQGCQAACSTIGNNAGAASRPKQEPTGTATPGPVLMKPLSSKAKLRRRSAGICKASRRLLRMRFM